MDKDRVEGSAKNIKGKIKEGVGKVTGDTKTEAIRALRRRISDEVYRRLRADELDATPAAGLSEAA